MTQRINLYKPEKPKGNFTFQHFMWVMGILFGGVLLVSIYDGIYHVRIKKEVIALQQKQDEENKKLALTAGEVTPEQTRNQILDEIKTYELMKSEKQAMINLVQDAETNKIPGFSGFLDALAKETVPGLWLTEFEFKNNGTYFSVEGSALNPGSVPEFMSAMGKESVFQGRTFEIFKLNLDEKTQITQFELQTQEEKKT